MTRQRPRWVAPRTSEQRRTGSPSAERHDDARVVQLQHAAGNRAVTGLVVSQRQDAGAGTADRPLDAAQATKAVEFYTSRPKGYTPGIVSELQAAVGAPVGDTVDEETVQAVARWQRDNGTSEPRLEIDGKAGSRTCRARSPEG